MSEDNSCLPCTSLVAPLLDRVRKNPSEDTLRTFPRVDTMEEGRQQQQQRMYETVTKTFEDVADVAFSQLQVWHRDGMTMPRLVRNRNVQNVVRCCGDGDNMTAAIRLHNAMLRLRKWKWRCCEKRRPAKFKDCKGAIYFRVKVSEEDVKQDFQGFQRVLKFVDEKELADFRPVAADLSGNWTGWKRDVNGQTFEGTMSKTFLITLNDDGKKELEIDKNMKYFAWSYPVEDYKRAPDELKDFLKYGGFMYFPPRELKQKWFLPPRELNQLASAGPPTQGERGIACDPPIWLDVKDVSNKWNVMQEVRTDTTLHEAGARYFCWVAPGDRLSEQSEAENHCPLGFPHGGFLYIGEFKKEHFQSTDLQEQYKKQWWDNHMEDLAYVINRDHDDKGQIEKGLLEKLKTYSNPERWKHSNDKDETILDVLHEGRYILEIPEDNVLLTTAYYSVLWFRFPFMFLMSAMLTIAAFLGALMQVMFSVFGDIYDQQYPAPSCQFLVFALLPALMVFCAVLVDQLWDLICSAFCPPYFVCFRARLLTIWLGWNGQVLYQEAPSRRLCLWLDAFFLLGLEGLPLFGALYNAAMLNLPGGLHRFWHLFYLGHLGKGDTIWGGYLTGMMYYCMLMVICYTIADVVYCVMEWGRPPDRSLRFIQARVTQAMETHRIHPMSHWYHWVAFDKSKTRGAESNQAPKRKHSLWVGRYHELDWKPNVEVSKLTLAWNRCIKPIMWFVPWISIVIYLWRQTDVHAPFELLNHLPEGFANFPWWITAICLAIAVKRTSMCVEHNFPSLVGYTYRSVLVLFSIILAGLFFGGSQYRPLQGPHASDSKLRPMMTVNGPGNGRLPNKWKDPGVARPYHICTNSWGSSDSPVSALDLAALSWIVYEVNERDIQHLLKESFGPGPTLENFTNYDEIPRWLAVRFPPGWRDLAATGRVSGAAREGADTVVVAVKGTSTFRDGYLDTDLFTTVKILQYFEFIAPVLKVLPVDMVQWILKEVKVKAAVGRNPETMIWGRLERVTKELRSVEEAKHRSTNFVLTGHSLGGGIAEIVAAKLGINALVWSAPGTLYSQGFFSWPKLGSVSEERMQRNVVVVVPDNDEVPRVDRHESVVQRIQCFDKNHTPVRSWMTCHPVVKSACEVWRVCGDAPMHRDFSVECSEYILQHELGQLYPVLGHPILGTREEQ